MDSSILFEGLADIFQVDVESIHGDYELSASTMDSLAIISIIAFADENFNVVLDGNALMNAQKVSDIQKLISESQKA